MPLKILKYIFTLVFIFGSLKNYSQSGEWFSSLNQTQNDAAYYNPANQVYVKDKELSLSPLFSFKLDAYLPFTVNQLISKDNSTGAYYANIDELLLSVRKRNNLFVKSSFNWFSYSGKNRKYNWNIAVREHFEGGLSFSKDAVKLLNFGNDAFRGEAVDLSFPIHALHYNSVSLTLAKQHSNRVDVGLTMKLFFGKSLMNEFSRFNILTDENGESIDMAIKGSGQVSSPISLHDLLNNNLNDFNALKYFTNFKNPGFGVDFGMSYWQNNNLELSASIKDLGFIFWNNNTTSFETDGAYTWKGIDVSGKLNFTELSDIKENSTIETFRDSFLNGLIVPSDERFFTLMPMRFSVGGKFHYSTKLKMSGSLHAAIVRNFIQYNLALSTSYSLSPQWSVLSGISFSNFSFVNFPVGISFKSNKLGASLILGNIANVIAPSSSKYYGGSINLSYRLGKFISIKNQHIKEYPFYQKRLIR